MITGYHTCVLPPADPDNTTELECAACRVEDALTDWDAVLRVIPGAQAPGSGA